MKKTLTKGVTGIGEFNFAHVLAPETFQGKSTNKFSISVKLNEEDKSTLLAQIDNEWNKFVESEEGRKHKYKYEYSNGMKEYNGDDLFKFKMTHIMETKKGLWERKVPIFDAKGNNITDSISDIGRGSKGKIAFELAPFYMNDKNYGVSLRLTAIQVLELVEGGADSASAFGFGQEDGYVKSEDDVSAGTPFDDDEDIAEDDEF